MDVKQSVYFLRCGITTDMSLISSRTVSVLFAVAELEPASPFVVAWPFVAGRLARSSRRLFLLAGSEALSSAVRVQTCCDIWLKSSI